MNTGIESLSELKRGLILWATILNIYALFYHREGYAHILLGIMQYVNFMVGVLIARWMIYRSLRICWRLATRLVLAIQVLLIAVLFWYGDLVMNDAPWDFLSLEVNGVC
jgi:hypothetical protein